MSIIGNRTFFVIGTYYCVPITIAVIIIFFVKTSRDERGRAILGKASIISTIAFIVFINIFARIHMQVPMDFDSIACYNGVGSEKFTASELYRCPNLSYNEDVLRERSIA